MPLSYPEPTSPTSLEHFFCFTDLHFVLLQKNNNINITAYNSVYTDLEIHTRDHKEMRHLFQIFSQGLNNCCQLYITLLLGSNLCHILVSLHLERMNLKKKITTWSYSNVKACISLCTNHCHNVIPSISHLSNSSLGHIEFTLLAPSMPWHSIRLCRFTVNTRAFAVLRKLDIDCTTVRISGACEYTGTLFIIVDLNQSYFSM